MPDVSFRLLLLAFVPIELFLQASLGVRNPAECAEWSRELLATCSAGSHTRHRAKMLNDPDSPFRHDALCC